MQHEYPMIIGEKKKMVAIGDIICFGKRIALKKWQYLYADATIVVKFINGIKNKTTVDKMKVIPLVKYVFILVATLAVIFIFLNNIYIRIFWFSKFSMRKCF